MLKRTSFEIHEVIQATGLQLSKVGGPYLLYLFDLWTLRGVMDDEEEQRLSAAFEEYVTRSLHSQAGWARKGGPRRHFGPDERLELAKLRAMVRDFELRNPRVVESNLDIPF